ncbi:MAG: hypothetical protein ACI97A_003980 [Planctomycetota bacterium]|jgi:hypothetical protein
MLRIIVLALIFVGLCLSEASSQIVRPIPRPTPRSNPPAVKSTPTPTRKDLRDRKNGSKPATTTPTPGGAGTPGAAGPAKGPKKPSRRLTKAADKRLKMRGSLMRAARTEIWSGVVVVPTAKKGEFKPKIKVELRRSRDGSVAQRFTYQRRGDLPAATRLVRRDAKGFQKWWLFRPEDRRILSVSTTDRLAVSALKFQDLVTLNLETLRAKFLEKKILDKKVVFVYQVNALATSEEPGVRVYVRNDTNLVSRIEYLDLTGKVQRQVLFSLPRSYGVHKRWTKIVVHDLEAGRSVTVLLKEIRINPDISDLRFLADKLGS